MQDLSDNRTFWKAIKPYFTNEGLNSKNFSLKKKEILSQMKNL